MSSIQALHAALSGQEAEMFGQLNARQQNRSNKSMDGQQLDSQQAEVGYSNYARRGAGKSSLARAGKNSLAKSSMSTSMSLNTAGPFPSEAANQDTGGLRRAQSTTSMQSAGGIPHIFYDSNS